MMLRRLAALAAVVAVAGISAPQPQPRPRAVVLPEADASGEAVIIRARPVALGLPPGSRATLRGALSLTSGDPRFGGLSAVAVTADGGRITLISDRGTAFTATLVRSGGAVDALEAARAYPLRMPDGRPLPAGWRDAESLATLPDGTVVIGFEGQHRLVQQAGPGGRPVPLIGPAALAGLQRNSGVEALAADGNGALYAMPERSGALDRPFPVWRQAGRGAAWQTGRWPRRPPHLVTGAAIGPDGRLYVLERDFALLRGWAMRLSRADLADWPDLKPQTLIDWRGEGIDNMEGIALHRDAGGVLRALIVADDNFHPLQRTLLLDLALPD